ncbi:MAG: hypothetical protein IKL10_08555 [Clostridia bacterium]|nr:hypothetical protein [Clostridia bacterium]
MGEKCSDFAVVCQNTCLVQYREMWAFISRQTKLIDISKPKKPKCDKAVSRSHIKHTLS